MKRFMRVAAFTLAILLANMAQAQSPIERQTQTGASGSTLTFNNSIGSGLMKLEYKISGSPATASIVLKGCMRGGTCDTLQTDTTTTDTMRLVSGLWDYMTIEPTFTGGSSPSVRVNWLAIARSPMGDAWGVIPTTPPQTNVNVAQWNGVAPTAATALSDAFANPTAPPMGAFSMVWDAAGSRWTRWTQTANTQNTTGAGIPNVSSNAQCDDTSPTALTENNFGPLRVDCRRKLYVAGGAQVAVSDDLPANIVNPFIASATLDGVNGRGLAVFQSLYDGVDLDAIRSIKAITDSDGEGITAAGIVGQFDDTATGTVTEGNYAPFRIDSLRRLRITGQAVDGAAPGDPVGIGLFDNSNNQVRHFPCSVQSTVCTPRMLGGSHSNMTTIETLTNNVSAGMNAANGVNLMQEVAPYGGSSSNGTINPMVQQGAFMYPQTTSAANTQQQVIIDLRGNHDKLSIHGVCSAGTAALTVEMCTDSTCTTAPLTIDSIAAAATQTKQYTATTVGATVALSPLASRYVRVTLAACGVGNTSTLRMWAK